VEDLETNTLADGAFHAAAWVLTVTSLLALLMGQRHRLIIERGPRVILGGLLMGWGAFDLVEGVVDHHILGLHHVRPVRTSSSMTSPSWSGAPA
jgi:uncharacterized membrane protein